LLSDRIGGPSVMPYQPPDFYNGKYERGQWMVSPGGNAYRRGMYTFLRRTSLHPMVGPFDAPSRGGCTGLRSRAHTPVQALVTLNDPTFVEAAGAFARRVLIEGPANLEGRIEFAFRAALARKPDDQEMKVVKTRYRLLLEHFRKDTEAAAKVAAAVKNSG